MLVAVGVITLLMLCATAARPLVPGRLQSLAEMSYEFVAGTVRSSAGKEGMRFFPFVFSLFMFVLILNLFGMIPYGFTVTSHIIITFALAALVIGTVIVYGFMQARHAFPRPVRAVRRAGVAPAAPGRDRGHLLRLAARSASRCVSSPTCWPAISR